MARGAKAVFGDELEADVVKFFTHFDTNKGSIPYTGISAIHHRYAPTVGAITKTMGWNEGDARLGLLNAHVYGHFMAYEIERRSNAGEDVSALETIAERMKQNVGTYSDVSRGDRTVVETLTKLFSFKSPVKSNLLQQLRRYPSEKENVFRIIDKLYDQRDVSV